MKTSKTASKAQRKTKPHQRWLRALAVFVLLLATAVLMEPLLQRLPADHVAQGWLDPLRDIATALASLAGAHLVYTLLEIRFLRRRKGKRPVPKVLLDLLRVLLFVVATLIGLSLLFRQDMSGILTGSGLVLAMLGFAIRNVVADTLSGIALGIEAPFRMGDWVRIETLAEGRVQEIGWRTTRLITRDSTYVILPNSQISRQRITNFSAPNKDYRDSIQLTLPVDLPAAQAKKMIEQAVVGAESIVEARKPEVQLVQYGLHGITYRVKYWVPQHNREPECRNELFSLVDAALREQGVNLTSQGVPFCAAQTMESDTVT